MGRIEIDKILFACIVASFISASNAQPEIAKLWPRYDALLGLWPLNGYYKLQDVSGNKLDPNRTYASLNTDPGPFGDPSSSYYASSTLMYVERPIPVKDHSSFTIAFFVKQRTPLSITDSVTFNPFIDFYHAVDSWGYYQSGKALGMKFGKSSTEPAARMDIYSATTKISSSYVDTNIWSFYALTFNRKTCYLSTYNRFGLVLQPSYQPALCSGQTITPYGFVFKGISGYFSCVTIYSDELNQNDVLGIYEACRILLGAPPCGAPRVPVPIPPNIPPVPPRRGQFPFIAVVRYQGYFKCSATIINPVWLLTTGSCIMFRRDAITTADYVISVGANDYSLLDSPYVKNYTVRTLFIHDKYLTYNGTYFNDIALIELSSPIDFSSPYVNDICLPWDRFHESYETRNYFTGFGLNGRQATVSQTQLRYSNVDMLPNDGSNNSSCEAALGSALKNDTMQCGISYPDPAVPCVGDEGAITMAYSTDTVHHMPGFAIAMYSYRASDCSDASKPPIFTDLKAYMPWIYSKIACTIPSRYYPTKCPL